MEIESKFKNEIQRITKVYQRFDTENLNNKIWAPFTEFESSFRCRQIYIFSKMMYKKGYINLEDNLILDYGCGIGRHLREFIDMGAKPEDLFGIDIQEKAISQAKALSPNINFSVCNGWDIEYPSESFDLVTQFVVFSSIGNVDLRKHIANEMVRVLKPGGYIYWWDMTHMASDAGGHKKRLDPFLLFPDFTAVFLKSGIHELPSDTIRPVLGINRLFAPLLNLFGFRKDHQGVLFGPKH